MQRRREPLMVATITAGNQPADSMGDQLPCRTASVMQLTATNVAASPATMYSHRVHHVISTSLCQASLSLTSQLDISSDVKRACHDLGHMRGWMKNRPVGAWITVRRMLTGPCFSA